MKPTFNGMPDPTYNKNMIDTDPIWKLAFEMSEMDNNYAPLGWGQYIHLATLIFSKYELRKKLTS